MNPKTHALHKASADRAQALGLDQGVALMQLMAAGLRAMLDDMPEQLAQAYESARRRWVEMDSSALLEGWRVSAWNHLGQKNGNSTTIDDAEDIAVRALICVLWDDAVGPDEYGMTADFFTQLMDRYAEGTK